VDIPYCGIRVQSSKSGEECRTCGADWLGTSVARVRGGDTPVRTGENAFRYRGPGVGPPAGAMPSNSRIQAWAEFARAHPQAVPYCFRGGLRSQIVQQWLKDEAGIDYPRVGGGYKAMRSFFNRNFDYFCHAAVVPQVYNFSTFRLHDPAHDINGRIMPIEQGSCCYNSYLLLC